MKLAFLLPYILSSCFIPWSNVSIRTLSLPFSVKVRFIAPLASFSSFINGYHSEVYEKGNDIIIVFRGTDIEKGIKEGANYPNYNCVGQVKINENF